MKRPTEMEAMKKLLLMHVDNMDITRGDANNIIYDSVKSAYKQLEEKDQIMIDRQLDKLDTVINRNGFGKVSQLELLASVAPYVNTNDYN